MAEASPEENLKKSNKRSAEDSKCLVIVYVCVFLLLVGVLLGEILSVCCHCEVRPETGLVGESKS